MPLHSRASWRDLNGRAPRGAERLPFPSATSQRLSEAGVVTSVGSRGDSYHALAESVIGLYKTELIRGQGPSKNLDGAECATLEWVDWFNQRRLLEPFGDIPPAELEQECYLQAAQREHDALKYMSLL